jgi:bisphosphoglycerate-dependent phosphoglycerate mutase
MVSRYRMKLPSNMSGKLFLIRHQESDWNKLGRWQGVRDRHLTEHGFEMAERLGSFFKDVQIDQAFTSEQVRTIETLASIFESSGKTKVPTIHTSALNERDYGIYTGKNKWEVEKEVGEETFQKIRRFFDYPIPDGESLQMVYDRILPFYKTEVTPLLNSGQNILVVAHGNSLRALLKYVDNLSNEEVAHLEFDFGTILIYETDEVGQAVKKDAWILGSRTQILTTIGPSSSGIDKIRKLLISGADAIRLNFSWGSLDEHRQYIRDVRTAAKELHKQVPIIIDLPGPRIQETGGHTYNKETVSCITERDKEFITFGIENMVDYFAVSFVGSAQDILQAKEIISSKNGRQKVIAKIERKVALDNFQEILEATDAVMIARGDLGEEIALEEIPFIEKDLIEKCEAAGKTVITATQMMLSMTEHPNPTRAEVTDVSYAITEGSDVVMLSDETANGKYPIEAVVAMEKIAKASERHLGDREIINPLTTI